MSGGRIVPAADNIDRAAREIRAGKLVGLPTETVYGLGADALNARAAARIFELKGRPKFDPLIVHIADRDSLEQIAVAAGEQAEWVDRLAERFWPGPLTLILPKRDIVPELVTSGLPSVAVRMPDSQVTCDVIRRAGVPVAAPSANLFGRVSPTTAAHVDQQFDERLTLILDDGPCRVGVESTILSLLDETPALLRPGGVPREDLEQLLGPVAVRMQPGSSDGDAGRSAAPAAPGQLPAHYAPRTPLRFCEPADGERTQRQRVGLLAWRRPESATHFAAVEVLSPEGDMVEAATRLYAAIRRLDEQSLDLIVADRMPEEGLGLAIMDRLRRAAATFSP